MVIPGQVEATVRIVDSKIGTGLGRVLACRSSMPCKRDHTRVEVVER